MKTHTKLLVAALLIIFVSCNKKLSPQTSEVQIGDFLIFVEKSNDDRITLYCKEGCAWKELSYALPIGKRLQAIDEFGMTNAQKPTPIKDKTLSNFLFTLQTTDSGIYLEGIEGTAWTKLSFSLQPYSKQAINQNGMTSIP
ncbi:MAG: hypothetical protein R3213_09225 [Flavobacteriaceae bacterium]|nr:hypothetical protein [Flavobacteriaceae bacterium]